MKISGHLPSGTINTPVFQYLIRPSACYVGVNKDKPTLLATINAILTAAKHDGSLNAIIEKWLHMPLPPHIAKSAH
jgi:polar amino acid transport system substrate-binding protein